MDNPEEKMTEEVPTSAASAGKQRAAAAAVALALAHQQPPVQGQAAQQPCSAWQAATRAIQLNQSIQRIHTRGRQR